MWFKWFPVYALWYLQKDLEMQCTMFMGLFGSLSALLKQETANGNCVRVYVCVCGSLFTGSSSHSVITGVFKQLSPKERGMNMSVWIWSVCVCVNVSQMCVSIFNSYSGQKCLRLHTCWYIHLTGVNSFTQKQTHWERERESEEWWLE